MLPEVSGVMSLSGQAYHVFYRIGSNTRKKDKNDFSRVYGDNVDNADLVLGIVQKHYPVLQDVAVRFGLYQRLDYLLHVPINRMNKENIQYKKICTYIRKQIPEIVKNAYLIPKNKVYLLLFAAAPKGLRKIHAWTMKIRGNN